MFTLFIKTETYDRRGNSIDHLTTLEPVMSSEDIRDIMVERYTRDRRSGYLIELNDRRCVKLTTRDASGKEIFFSDAFEILEGTEAFLDVLEGRAPAQDAASYVAAIVEARA